MRSRWDLAGRAVGLGGALAAGVALALLVPLGRRWLSARELPVRLWAADRGAATLVGLDRDLIVRQRVELGGIRAVAGAREGGAWALVERGGVVEALRLAASGECLARYPLSPSAALCPGPAGRALVFERDPGGQRPIQLLGDGVRPRVLARLEGVRCADWSDSGILLGTRAGELLLLSEAGRVLATRALDSAILSVTTADASRWALDELGGLVRLDARLRVRARSSIDVRGRTGCGLVGLDDGRVVVLAAERGELFALGADGTLDWTRRETFLIGLRAGVDWGAGGLVVTTPGALVAFDGRGRCLPGQGGFDYLTAVAESAE